MGHPIHTNSSIIKSTHEARIQNAEQQRDETRRRQFALTLQQEAARKKTQVQDSHKAEAPKIRKEPNKEKHRKRQKRTHKEPVDEKQGSEEEQHHIDLKVD